MSERMDRITRALDAAVHGDPLTPSGHADDCPSRSGGKCPRDGAGIPECRR